MFSRSCVGRVPVGVIAPALLALLSCSSRREVTAQTGAPTTTALLSRYHLSASVSTDGLALDRIDGGFAAHVENKAGLRVHPLGGGLSARLPAHADEPTRLAVANDPGMWVELRGEGLSRADVVVEPRALVFRDAAKDVDVLHVALDGAVEEFRVLRSARAATASRWSISHGPGIRSVRLREGRVEALDETGAVRFASDPIVAEDAGGANVATTARLEDAGSTSTLTIDVDLHGASFPVIVDPKWKTLAATPPYTPGYGAAAAPLGSDRYLMTGGHDSAGGVHDDAALLTLAPEKWTSVGTLNVGRQNHGMATLSGGGALVFGGQDQFGNYLKSAERYNPTTSGFDLVAPMNVARQNVGSLTLTSGKVLVVGGYAGSTALSSAEIYDPVANTWTLTGNMPGAGQFIGLIQDSAGTVFAAGSLGVNTTARLSLATNTWATGPNMLTSYASGNMFRSGSKIAFVGASGPLLDVLDLGTDTWKALTAPAAFPWATQLTDGTVLLVTNEASSRAYLYQPTTESTALTAASGAAVPYGGGNFLFAASNNRAVSLRPPGALFINSPIGVSCTADDECASSFCTDGVCCDKRCNSQCQACNESGSVGTCKTVSGAPRAPRAACGGSGACAATCDGTSLACSAPAATTVCTAASCAGNTFTDAAYCDGAGSCTAATPTPCGAYACSATGCKTTCASETDCASGKVCTASACVDAVVDAGTDTSPSDTGMGDSGTTDTGMPDTGSPDTDLADTASADSGDPVVTPDAGAKPTVTADFHTCSAASECPSGFCVDGVCCDRACDGTCESCALPSSPGRCSIAPLGVDPRGQCGAGDACLATCDGTGKCRTAFTGSQCAPNRCTSPNGGTGAAFCVAQGAACPTAAAVPFDCGAYACEPAFGACLTTCQSSSQCAPGNVCDLATKSCIGGAAPANDDGGCTVVSGVGSGDGSDLTVLLAAAAVVVARRRAKRASARS